MRGFGKTPSVTVTFVISIKILHLYEAAQVSRTSRNLSADRNQVNQSKSQLPDRITSPRTIIFSMCKMLKLALLHIVLRNFLSAQTLPHGKLEHKPYSSRSCNFSHRANHLYTSWWIIPKQIQAVREDCHHWHGAAQIVLALEKQMSTVLDVPWQRDNEGWRVKNCFLLCFLPTTCPVSWTGTQKGFLQPGPTTLWASLTPEHSSTSQDQQYLETRRSWPSLGRVRAVPGKGPQQLCSSHSPWHHCVPQHYVAAYQLGGISVPVCFSTTSSWRGRQRPTESRDPLLGRILHCRVSFVQLISLYQLLCLKSVYNLQRWWQSKQLILSVPPFHTSSLLLHFSSTGINLIPLIFLPWITTTVIPSPLLICTK